MGLGKFIKLGVVERETTRPMKSTLVMIQI